MAFPGRDWPAGLAWLHRAGLGVRSPAARAVGVGAAVALTGLLLQWLGVGLPLLLAAAILVGLVAWMFPYYGVQLLDWAIQIARGLYWARDEGRYHSFAGVPLSIEDDGRHVWLDGPGLLRVLARRESDDVLAARLAGQWRRDDRGVLMLRVDAVVHYLAQMPERNDPRVQRFRRYLEREVLYPASQRRARG